MSAVIENVLVNKCVSHGLPLNSGVLTGPPRVHGSNSSSDLMSGLMVT